jgi:NADPH:quinone reductase-like Zn-dependent oxidoreductase
VIINCKYLQIETTTMNNDDYSDYLPGDVNNKFVLITGGTTGIGRATACLLVKKGKCFNSCTT